MTKQEITEAIVGCAAELGRVPNFQEVVKKTQVTRRQMRKYFGSYGHALRECDLEREAAAGQKVPLEKLLADWAGVVRKVGKAPSMSEYEALSRYSCKPLVRCFGSWKQVAYGLKQFAEGSGRADEWQAELALAAVRRGEDDERWQIRKEAPPKRPTIEVAGPAYGPPMWPGALAYAPVNEMGVVFLFGVMAQQLGFVVHRLQTEFPDCEAMRRVEEEKCQLVRIEFEYESRNFLKHMHEASGCDLIVCWRHNWPECPRRCWN